MRQVKLAASLVALVVLGGCSSNPLRAEKPARQFAGYSTPVTSVPNPTDDDAEIKPALSGARASQVTGSVGDELAKVESFTLATPKSQSRSHLINIEIARDDAPINGFDRRDLRIERGWPGLRFAKNPFTEPARLRDLAPGESLSDKRDVRAAGSKTGGRIVID